ncbi:unnamed protein product [Moneuplotes crassus]|uniref:Uncharacterized protein n=1 Tax=Euplotes crassus TaxID=5936 RepID=A0AAD1X7E0_EUPCR|nr:unnamed protein product [Moneuplotes crassus]
MSVWCHQLCYGSLEYFLLVSGLCLGLCSSDKGFLVYLRTCSVQPRSVLLVEGLPGLEGYLGVIVAAAVYYGFSVFSRCEICEEGVFLELVQGLLDFSVDFDEVVVFFIVDDFIKPSLDLPDFFIVFLG